MACSDGKDSGAIMARTAETRRSWNGPAILGAGFRPFFLLAAVWAILAIAIWPFFLTGEMDMPTAFGAVDWHGHEMIFGYGAAVVAGFLLTAVPNWTGRLPVAGWPLAALALLWIAGRVSVFASAPIGWRTAALIDTSFLVVFAAVAGREVLAGRNGRNVKVVLIVAVLALANAACHAEAAVTGAAPVATRAGLAVIILLILLIGGRIVPSFTRNWLTKHGATALPVPFGSVDTALMLLSAAGLAAWVVIPAEAVTGGLLVAGGLGNLWRLSRWRGVSARSDALVLVLHAGFLCTALGFLFMAAAIFRPDLVSPAAMLHVWAVGAVGVMTLAVMTRATLGHTGRALVASRATRWIYLAVVAAALLRVTAGFLPAISMPLVEAAAAAWVVGFAGFVIVYGPMLLRMRPKD